VQAIDEGRGQRRHRVWIAGIHAIFDAGVGRRAHIDDWSKIGVNAQRFQVLTV
jgi:hypothetical protein